MIPGAARSPWASNSKPCRSSGLARPRETRAARDCGPTSLRPCRRTRWKKPLAPSARSRKTKMTGYNYSGGTMASKTAPAAPPVLGLHHSAYRCRDAEETRHFYEDILGLPLVHVVTADHVSTGKSVPFAHVFFELADGSCIGFFGTGDNVGRGPSTHQHGTSTTLALKV